MKLSQLLNAEGCGDGFRVHNANSVDTNKVEITNLAIDSRQVSPGSLFAALTGERVDGTAFVSEAVERGALSVLCHWDSLSRVRDAICDAGVVLVGTDNPRRSISRMAATFYHPQPSTVAAVTGTNGKSSVAHFVQQIWSLCGLSSGSIGTLGVVGVQSRRDMNLTTPDPLSLHAVLMELAQAGVTHVAMEASSHGLSQHRLDGVQVQAAAFTNLSQDHLDYHGTMDAYFAAKARLFTELLVSEGQAVLYMGRPEGEKMARLCRDAGKSVMPVGFDPDCEDGIRLTDFKVSDRGQQCTAQFGTDRFPVHLPLYGSFQLHNAAVAAGLAIATGVEPERVFEAMGRLDGVPGRLELIGRTKNGAPVMVDYAHTPDALDAVLSAVRQHTERKLHVVFGAGGDRDKAKRPLMGRVAGERADHCIVTDDNPRSEGPEAIRAAILEAAPQAVEIGDRAEAIQTAIAELCEGDVLIVAGKGHETGQQIGDKILPFDDRQVVRAALAAEGGSCV